ncbi:hypothetical protein BAE44_0000686 [Dichanthelium oligosanthes]|uniref:F-box/LRR-repeat protein 15/At3g58940/PEG3-like LRR domain-containing protein n=1 Tax=Dichanthelium oligosanthes TaxID=888268 RepID=A0A1E5WLJ6_9POAL|nr:hypothetical protein BAE44_0000686 [Dichanthelium oligosanthes]
MGSHSGASGDARLSVLGDAVLGHMLLFLPADEAVRAATLSRRWCHVVAYMHTVALEEPEPPIPDYDGDYSPGYSRPFDRNAVDAPLFSNAVSAALFGHLRLDGEAGVPLCAIRVGFERFSGLNAGLVEMWLWYAMRQASEELHVDLRLRRQAVCGCSYSLQGRRATDDMDKANGAGGEECSDHDSEYVESENDGEDEDPASPTTPPANDDDPASLRSPLLDDDEEEPPPPRMNEYIMLRSLFSCAALRTLRIGPCRLDLPAATTIALPSVATLHLTHVTGRKSAVQQLVSVCPCLADLTLEAYEKLTKLAVLGIRLRRLAL